MTIETLSLIGNSLGHSSLNVRERQTAQVERQAT